MKEWKWVKYLVGGVVGFVVMFVAVFFGVQFATKTGVFRIPGVVIYDESLSEEEVSMLSAIFTEEVDLDKNVTISAREELRLSELSEGEFLYNIYVPVTDFYSEETSVSADCAENLRQSNCMFTLINVDDLNFKQKLLSVNGEYYLDSFKTGAIFRIISFESEKYTEEIAPLVTEAMTREFPSASTVLTMAQTGVTAFSRRMNATIIQEGVGTYFSANIGKYLSSFDLTHTSNESSFSDWAPTSGATGTPICADNRFKETLLDIGLDIVELTGNHNRDCGDGPATASVEFYLENGIKLLGGGRSADEAAIPLEIDQKGNNITMLAYNLSTGGATYDDTPGANQYYEEVAAAQIAAAKERGDLVIVDIQYYECNAYASEYEDPICDYPQNTPGDEVEFFRHLIDLGADIVVGTSAHQPQAYELYGNGEIYYGLGNLFFDQYKWPGTTRSLILAHYFYNGKLLQTKVVPTVYDGSFQTQLMDEETARWYLTRLKNARP